MSEEELKPICPLRLIAMNTSTGRPVTARWARCIEDDCAMWNDLAGCCGLIALGQRWHAELARVETVVG